MASFWKEKQLGWTQGFILPKSETFLFKCENEGIFGMSNRQIAPKKKESNENSQIFYVWFQ
jgi:hypothetical protein